MNARLTMTWLAACVLALLLSTPLTAADVFQGQVVSSVNGQLVVLTGGDEITFLVASDAVITLDGRPADLIDLTFGHIANVTAERNGEQWTAHQIDAFSQR